MNCNGCGVVLDPIEEQVNAAVDQVLDSSLADARHHGGVCPLCGHSKKVPSWNRKSLLFGLLVICLMTLTWIMVSLRRRQETERATAVKMVLAKMQSNANVARLLGTPMRVEPGVSGDVTHDETGWKEAHLSLLVRGPKDEAKVKVIGGQAIGPWVFTTLEVIFEKQHKKLDLISGKIFEYEPNTYVEVHTQAAMHPEYNRLVAAAPRFEGTSPCVFAPVVAGSTAASLGRCAMPTTHAGGVDRFEADLRYGAFVLRQSDLELNDVFDVPLTRSYNSEDWLGLNRVHAFGRNSNHPYDIAPLGSRNPYTNQMLALEDGDLLSGTWANVLNLTSSPTYPPNDGINYESYTFDFTPISGDAIRINGAPGDTAYLISVGELQVYGYAP